MGVATAVFCALHHPTSAQAFDSELVNNSTDYVDVIAALANVPVMPTTAGDCTATPSSIGNCTIHGSETPAAAANNTFFDPAGPFYAAPDWANITGYGLGLADAMDNGLFDNGGVYWAGLSYAWTNVTDALNNPERGMGMPNLTGADSAENNVREDFIDQAVVGYVVAWDSIGASDEFAQNFRTQLSWNGSDAATALAVIDQRLEQSVNLIAETADHTANPIAGLTADIGGAYEASRQTLQQAFKVYSGVNTTTLPENTVPNSGVTEGTLDLTSLDGQDGGGMNQLVSQDIEGYFFSCMGCDSADMIASGAATHDFGSPPIAAVFVNFTWDVDFVPTVKVGGP